jgi:hypothetical protein
MSIPNVTLAAGSGQAAVGSVLYIATNLSPNTFLPIGNQGDIKWDQKNKTADTTNQGLSFMQSIPTITDPGTVTVKMHMIPSSLSTDSSGNFGHGFTSGLGQIFTSKQIRQFKFVFSDGVTTEYFEGYITDFPIDAAVEKDIEVELKIQVTGEPIYA